MSSNSYYRHSYLLVGLVSIGLLLSGCSTTVSEVDKESTEQSEVSSKKEKDDLKGISNDKFLEIVGEFNTKELSEVNKELSTTSLEYKSGKEYEDSKNFKETKEYIKTVESKIKKINGKYKLTDRQQEYIDNIENLAERMDVQVREHKNIVTGYDKDSKGTEYSMKLNDYSERYRVITVIIQGLNASHMSISQGY